MKVVVEEALRKAGPVDCGANVTTVVGRSGSARRVDVRNALIVAQARLRGARRGSDRVGVDLRRLMGATTTI